jgi:hypothetical protein
MAKSEKVLVNSKVKKSMTIAELEKSDRGPVYVLNATSQLETSGQILITIPKKNGNGSDLLKVPKTFIPIDLAAQISRSQILESSEFRKAVLGGMLKLVTQEYAELLLESDQGREEQRRLDNERNRTKTILANAGVTEDRDDSSDDDYVDRESVGREAKAKAVKAAGKGDVKVSVKLQTLVNSAAEEELNQKQIVNRLLNYGKLQKVDIIYLGKQYKDKPIIMKHLRGVLEELKAAAA